MEQRSFGTSSHGVILLYHVVLSVWIRSLRGTGELAPEVGFEPTAKRG
jgi:hypothetical protein